MRVHLFVNTHRPDAVEAARKTGVYLRQHGADVGADAESADRIDAEARPLAELADADLVVTFGGDGTLIRAAHVCAEAGTPILGVYYGKFGFVTQCEPHEVGAALSMFFDGKARIEERMMVQTDLLRHGRTVATLHSLNEAVLQRAATTRMLEFEVTVDGHLLTTYPADGVLVATPTGSTAYNLSAGGPIVDPRMRALIVAAITPHTLSARPLVLGPDSLIHVRIETRGDAVLSCDGQSRLQMLSGDEVYVTRSPRVTRLVSVDQDDFLEKLSRRLFWSRRLKPEDD